MEGSIRGGEVCGLLTSFVGRAARPGSKRGDAIKRRVEHSTFAVLLESTQPSFNLHKSQCSHTAHWSTLLCRVCKLREANLEMRVGVGEGKANKKKSDVAASECPGRLPVGLCGYTITGTSGV
eukprot:770804-Pleurochrysis_carterae.AAC.1